MKVAHRKNMTSVLAIGVVLTGVAFGSSAAASDSSTAQKLVITQRDVGPVYTAKPLGVANSDEFTKLAQCVGKPAPQRTVSSTLLGLQLTNPSTFDWMASRVEIFKTKRMARADRPILHSSKYLDCLKQVSQAENDARSVDVLVVTRLKTFSAHVFKPVFGASFVDATETTALVAGGRATLTKWDITAQKGRAEIHAFFLSTSRNVKVDDFLAALTKLNRRLKSAKV